MCTLSSKIEKTNQTYSVRATSKGISRIDLVPPKFLHCAVLFISHNSIHTLKKIDQFRCLTRLMVEYNNICWLKDLDPLKNITTLYELRLEGNPVCRIPLWDFYVIELCKNLMLLNGKVVRVKVKFKEELEYSDTYTNFDIPLVLYLEEEMLNNLFYTEIAYKIVNRINSFNNLRTDNSKSKQNYYRKQMLEIIRKEFVNANKTDFINQIKAESPTQEVDQYLLYLEHLLLKKYIIFHKVFPKWNRLSHELFEKHQEGIKKFEQQVKQSASNTINHNSCTALSSTLASYELQSIGILTSDEITEHLSQYQDENIKGSLTLAAVASLSDSTNTTPTKSLTPKPTSLTISNISPKSISNSSSILKTKSNQSSSNNFSLSSYHPILSIDFDFSKENQLNIGCYSPKLETVEDFEFEVPEEDLQAFIDAIDESSTDSSDDREKDKELTFDNQMEREIVESETMSQTLQNNPRFKHDYEGFSSDSYRQQQQILDVNPIITTIPISDISGSDIYSYDGKVVSSGRNQVLKKISHIPNSFLGKKYFRLWKSKFVNKNSFKKNRRNLNVQSFISSESGNNNN